MIGIQERVSAVTKTIEKFQGKELEYGKNDCAKMAAFCLRQMKVNVGAAKFGAYKTPVGARAALKRAGCKSLADAVDKVGLMRIGYLSCYPGDIIAFKGKDGDVALHIFIEQGRSFGLIEGVFQVGQPIEIECAWRSERG